MLQRSRQSIARLFYESSLVFAVARRLYPVTVPPIQQRKELKVVCLGLPQSATESLSRALRRLGYGDVSHGLDFWRDHAESSIVYYELALMCAQGRLPDGPTMRTKYFDRVLGSCEATTDIPSVWVSRWVLGFAKGQQLTIFFVT